MNKLVIACGIVLLELTSAWADGSTTQTRNWSSSFVARLEALALLETLNSELLSNSSATLTLEHWCDIHHLAYPARIKAVRISDVDKPVSFEQRQELHVTPTEPVRYRKVQLKCGSVALSEADNWYVPSRLTPEMNKLLDTTDAPFGRVVQTLNFQRRTLYSKLLWLPLPEGWEEPDEWLEAGTVRVADRILRILPTPGHTQGHIVFADEQAGLLFAGDHVLPHITPSIGFEAVPSDAPLADYLDSLALIRALPDLTLLPAHGFVAASTHARVDELVAHHDARLRETGQAVASLGSATAAQVAAVLGWTRRRRSFASLDPFNQMLAVTETVAHLKLLVASGVLTADGDVVVSYRPAALTPPA